ncbi:hypothetical protein F0U61_39745 [Archangium violaceum]|uniref:hypothetical protein n=1 Tax=Archangium violaceum TaxID=83451 RepID=UPI002B312B5E|nr:hypothetical protein F0U61_39745 [Archangium violaceum]
MSKEFLDIVLSCESLAVEGGLTMMKNWLKTLVYGVLPGAISGGFAGAYHRERALSFDALRWAEPSKCEPWGAGPGLVLGALAGAVVFAVVRRLWSRLPGPLVAALSASCVALLGVLLSATRVD